MRADKDPDGNIIGHWDNYNKVYTPITPAPPFNNLLIQTYEDCMRACNTNGRQCRERAEMKLARAGMSALATIGGTTVGGLVTGTLISPGPGSVAGLVGGLLTGIIAGGVQLAGAQAEFQMEIRHCRETYNNCVTPCKQLRTKNPDDNDLSS
jgi:hypothetical protein